MRKLYENFHIFYFQKRIVSTETIRGYIYGMCFCRTLVVVKQELWSMHCKLLKGIGLAPSIRACFVKETTKNILWTFHRFYFQSENHSKNSFHKNFFWAAFEVDIIPCEICRQTLALNSRFIERWLNRQKNPNLKC